jgi:hypothetical protein
MTTWITVKNGKAGRIRQQDGEDAPGPEWIKVPDDWGGNPGDDLSWFDEAMRRIPDAVLVETGKRIDKRGRWFNKTDCGKTRLIQRLDEELDENWTREMPLENEPYQNWDDTENRWAVDTARKNQAEKEQRVAEKKSAIQNAEQRIQRSLIAREAGIATDEDKQYFSQINAEIMALREELRELQG